MKLIFSLFFLSSWSIFFSQERIQTTIIDSISITAKIIYEFDNNVTYYTKENVFYKKSEKKEYEYNNFSLGTISKVDLYNPLQLILFYQDFNTVVLLDNQLTEIYRVNGNNLDTPISFGATGQASQNQIWFYDFFTQKIGLYNFNINTIKYISTPLSKAIKYYQSDYNNFYWIDEENNFYQISLFGKITSFGTIPLYDKIQITNDKNILYKKSHELFFLNLKENKSYKIDISKNSFDNFYYKNGILSIFTTDKVINYKIQLP